MRLILIFCCLFLIILPLSSEVVIITHPANKQNEVSSDFIKKVYLNKITRWDSGSLITLTYIKKGPVHNDFLKKYVGKSTSRFKRFWKKMVFTGRGTQPKTFKDEEGLIDYIKENKSSIGYVDKENISDGVKILTIK
jgi:ABC-type phosphate transport system substrate-binding protein